jgi:ribosomal protein L21
MKRYKNISNSLLSIDCINFTIHLNPNAVATLPFSRDVKYYLGSKKLVELKQPIVDKEEVKQKVVEEIKQLKHSYNKYKKEKNGEE